MPCGSASSSSSHGSPSEDISHGGVQLARDPCGGARSGTGAQVWGYLDFICIFIYIYIANSAREVGCWRGEKRRGGRGARRGEKGAIRGRSSGELVAGKSILLFDLVPGGQEYYCVNLFITVSFPPRTIFKRRAPKYQQLACATFGSPLEDVADTALTP